MDLGLSGRAVLITGGSKGIGAATARAYAREGAHVAITYATDEQAATAVTEEIGGGAFAVRLDLADRPSVTNGVRQAIERLGRLDVLVANAPLRSGRGPFDTVSAEELGQAVRDTIEGTAETVRVAVPHLAQSDAGRIVFVSTGVSRHGTAGMTAYGTAKGSLDGFVASLRWELGAQGTLVNIVSPGLTLSEGVLERTTAEYRDSLVEQTPSGRASTPEDVANAILFLGSPANGNITGAYLPVSGGKP